MNVTKEAVDAAANLLGPYLQSDRTQHARSDLKAGELVKRALYHLQAINAADLTADANAPYDASLAGVVYGLLDMVTLLGIIPNLSPGVAFSQRPKSVLFATFASESRVQEDGKLLPQVIQTVLPILEQEGSGIQPLISQRVLPDIVTALAELSHSPTMNLDTRSRYLGDFQRIVWETPTSRLLPILITLLQQPLPPWLKPIVAHELSIVPLRAQGVRHIVEFLSLSSLSKNSQVPQDASGPQSQIPIPIEAISQASRLLALPPTGTSQDEWLRKLTPQLLGLLDGAAGKELIRAAGQIIADGILSKKTTGAPGTVGWDLFAMPILQTIYPKEAGSKDVHGQHRDEVLVQDVDLEVALRRLCAICTSSSHAGLLRRVVGPLLLPLWALLNFAKATTLLDKQWTALPDAILSHYVTATCDVKHIDKIAMNLFWDGDAPWAFGSGSHGGVEIRRRSEDTSGFDAMNNILSRIGDMDARTELLTSLLANANVSDETAGTIFLQVTKRWLSPAKKGTPSLTDESDGDILTPLIDAKLSESLASKFKDKLARSPRHIIELMSQLIQNAVNGYKSRVNAAPRSISSSRAMFENIVSREDTAIVGGTSTGTGEPIEDDLVSYALSVLHTLVSSSGFKQSAETTSSLHAIIPSLIFLGQDHKELDISPLIRNSASALFHLMSPPSSFTTRSSTPPSDALREHRATLKEAQSDLTSPDPPNRAWALKTMYNLIRSPTAFPVIDVPSLTHTLLSVSLADPESYVHTAAAPVILELAIRAPDLVVKIISETFIDVDEVSLKLGRGKQTEEKKRALQESLDFRLRTGEVLNTIVLADDFWSSSHGDRSSRYTAVRRIVEACLSLASRRGQRQQTQSTRRQISDASLRLQKDTESAWNGPIPNVLEPEGRDPKDQEELDALSNMLREWENTGLEEDVRIRTSALSVLSVVLHHRFELLRQAMVDASLQMVLTMLVMETSEVTAMLRRSGALVLLGLLHGLYASLEQGWGGVANISMTQQREMERVVRWMCSEDVDALVRDHAVSVVEGLETLSMRRLHKMRDAGSRLGPNLELEGGLRGLGVTPGGGENAQSRRMVVEEVE
ncbi:hypothetical protein T440DRAFT_503667 [Plenodomus tracheiphilus IPT5]|uniref:RNA polymerase II assembly factor Rtp1 C-terminal domain-containing protein n=1 Tax=Plenodomus tracheiphilus IPT5 TaxID=1408161 RepID=A0A6A7BKQ2_9PLEO|nr:hypothetical protein T440DRAFT_503667 [Plenodomus tracheiphilus IPT5]